MDPSGGGPDAFTLAVMHAENEAIVDDISPVVKRYGLKAVTGGAYAGRWVAQASLVREIRYEAGPEKRG